MGSSWKPRILLQMRCNETLLHEVLSSSVWVQYKDFLEINSEVIMMFQEKDKLFSYEVFTIKGNVIVKPIVLLESKDEGDLGLGWWTHSSLSLIQRRENFQGIGIKGVTQVVESKIISICRFESKMQLSVQEDDNLDLVASFTTDSIGKLQFSGGVSVSYFQLMAYGLNFS
jgi:hypothetical protein